MKWFRYIFKIDAVYTDAMPLRDLFFMYGVFVALFMVLDGLYILLINIFSLDSLTLTSLSFAKYFLIPIAGILAIHMINFIYTYFLITKRQYKVQKTKNHYLGHTLFAKHFIYPNLNFLEAHLIKEDNKFKIYDSYFTASYKKAYISHYHTIFEAKLIKKVPHLFFDSKLAKSQQFKVYFKSGSKIKKFKLLNDFFNIYMDDIYKKESLDFIKTNINKAILRLQECDIELVDNRLLCYAPLLPENKLADFENVCLDLLEEINKGLKKHKLLALKDKKNDLEKMMQITLDRIIIKDLKRQLIIFIIFLLVGLLSVWFLVGISSTWAVVLGLLYGCVNLSLLLNVLKTFSINKKVA